MRCDWRDNAGESAQFGFLQIRPLVLSQEAEELHMEAVDAPSLLAQSTKVLGNGRWGICGTWWSWTAQRFERAQSQEVAGARGVLQRQAPGENRPYLLVGVGRWGSNDPWLGIPVEWDDISGARVILEAGFRDFRVTPSQGSHFFQNLSAFQVGYFTVNPDLGEGMGGLGVAGGTTGGGRAGMRAPFAVRGTGDRIDERPSGRWRHPEAVNCNIVYGLTVGTIPDVIQSRGNFHSYFLGF